MEDKSLNRQKFETILTFICLNLRPGPFSGVPSILIKQRNISYFLFLLLFSETLSLFLPDSCTVFLNQYCMKYTQNCFVNTSETVQDNSMSTSWRFLQKLYQLFKNRLSLEYIKSTLKLFHLLFKTTSGSFKDYWFLHTLLIILLLRKDRFIRNTSWELLWPSSASAPAPAKLGWYSLNITTQWNHPPPTQDSSLELKCLLKLLMSFSRLVHDLFINCLLMTCAWLFQD